MTLEEAIEIITLMRDMARNSVSTNTSNADALDMAIQALEQEPCEDYISREQAIKQCGFGMTSLLIADCIRRLPSIRPLKNEQTDGDLISRKDLLKELEKWDWQELYLPIHFKELVDELPSAEKTTSHNFKQQQTSQALSVLNEIKTIVDSAEMIIEEQYGVVIVEGYADVFDLIKKKVRLWEQ